MFFSRRKCFNWRECPHKFWW